MPFGRRTSPPPAPVPAPADWRPQPIDSHNFRKIADPIIEPAWGGVRVLARAVRGADGSVSVTLQDEDGGDATVEFEEVAKAVATATLADELIIDGFLTVEATQAGEGRAVPEVVPPRSGYVTHMILGGKQNLPEADRRLDPEVPIAFVAVDLLLIDGSTLVDLPLVERKRLLDSALEVGELVRITPFVRPPLGSLIQSWYSNGFREMVFKSANGRYNPDGKPGEWALAPIRAR